ncbi:hypothetical protein [Leuconostoc lactis]|uniref:hypothetical protein n=2 Tax=Leuconostoc lactis TaxID=1246 RepID=UPI00020DA24C|nr:hypothetical protein [Leuconostoc lactis]KQB80421.1 hypothetical protein AN225_07415 [Leuconostoc lactis]ORI84948.1 hypothetical protein BMS94_03020 [Leuconostoc lactis]ORI87270.1 hypothetical protein BMS96_02255 [Leuconostoc lactis]
MKKIIVFWPDLTTKKASIEMDARDMPGTLVIPLTATQIFLEIIEVDGSSGWSDYRMKGQIFPAVNSQPKNKGCKEKTDGVAMRISEEFINYYTAKMVVQPVLTF